MPASKKSATRSPQFKDVRSGYSSTAPLVKGTKGNLPKQSADALAERKRETRKLGNE